MSALSARQVHKVRDPVLRMEFAVILAVAIAVIGYVMMTIGSSPTVKGASFIWLPAALQLTAGVWLGPWLGFLSGGIGAYAAGILAYGGWGLVDIIMNLIAGGFANSLLPAVLFRAFGIDPLLGAKKQSQVSAGFGRMLILSALVLGAGMVNIALRLPSPWGFALPLVTLFVGARILLSNLGLDTRSFSLAIIVAVVVCGVSAFIGAVGATVGGKPFAAALMDPGVGWFAGDTPSAMLGVYLLPMFTKRLRDAGIAE